jgi:N-acyl-D-aspartate/D-glutamate deacylase
MKADVNVIDFDQLRLHPPEMVFDLPANGRRFIQRVDGYRYTVVNGEVSYENGEPTGAMPGKVIRGPQSGPTCLISAWQNITYRFGLLLPLLGLSSSAV